MNIIYKTGAVILLLIIMIGCNEQKINGQLLTNHLGYQPNSPKNVIFQTDSDYKAEDFCIKDKNDNIVYEGKFDEGGQIDQWHTGNAFSGRFNDFDKSGTFYIESKIKNTIFTSKAFKIEKNLIAKNCLPLILQGLKSIHPEDKYEDWDSNIGFFGDREDRVDVHGGWYDASGDFSKYFSHLCYTNYMSPQQTPMVVYNLFSSAINLKKMNKSFDQSFIDELIKESSWGADFLVRMQDEKGFFYTIVFDTWTKDPTLREICAYETMDGTRTNEYQAAFREGAGIAIAALAKLANAGVSAEYSSEDYLKAAINGFDHLIENNISYCDDGKENIIDDYTALMAATELYITCNENKYLAYAQMRANNLINRLSQDSNYKGWFMADHLGNRPYFHAAEAGYPIIALSKYLEIETDESKRKATINTIQQNIDFELSISNDVFNPFGYPRQYVKDLNSDDNRASFFIPHQNESGYWYQGENARIASLSAAFSLSRKYMRADQSEKVSEFRSNTNNWILGLNPYDICMLDGIGHNNPEYLAPHDWNYLGGIANGITAGVENKNDIAFLPEPQKDDPSQNWRWPEQWIPHAGWFIYAISLEEE